MIYVRAYLYFRLCVCKYVALDGVTRMICILHLAISATSPVFAYQLIRCECNFNYSRAMHLPNCEMHSAPLWFGIPGDRSWNLWLDTAGLRWLSGQAKWIRRQLYASSTYLCCYCCRRSVLVALIDRHHSHSHPHPQRAIVIYPYVSQSVSRKCKQTWWWSRVGRVSSEQDTCSATPPLVFNNFWSARHKKGVGFGP